MRVLWISHFVPYPPAGGNLQRSYHLIRSLAAEAEIDLVTFHRRASLAGRDLEGARNELSKICRRVEIFPIRNERSRFAFGAGLARNLFQRDPYTAAELGSVPFRECLEARLRETRYDAVHFDTIDLARYRLFAGDLPTAMNHHNVESLLFRRRAPYERNRLAGLYLSLQAAKLERYERRWYGRFTTNLFVSETDRLGALDGAPRFDSHVVPNGVDTDYYRPGAESGAKNIVWVGGLGWFPNRDAVHYLLGDIWPRIRERLPDTRLDLIGSAPPGLLPPGASAPGVTVHGFVDDLRPLVTAASVFVVPIRVGGGTRLKILDAMAMGKAIVTTSIGCEGIDPADGEEMVLADSTERFVEQVCALLEDVDRRRALGAAARSSAERRFSWEKAGAGFVEIYRALASSGASSRREETDRGE